MRIVWKPRANNFWAGVLDNGIKMPLRFSGMEYGAMINDVGYVAKEVDGFVVRFYGSVYSGKHPIERIIFATKEEAMESAERHVTAILAAKILSR